MLYKLTVSQLADSSKLSRSYIYQVRGGGTANIETTTGYTAGEWHHLLAYSSSDTDHHVFIDGGGEGSSSDDISVAGVDTTSLGARVDGIARNQYLSGAIADARIYNRVLSNAEIRQLNDPSTRWDLYEPMPRVFPVTLPERTIIPAA